jgi:hypothetical protein
MSMDISRGSAPRNLFAIELGSFNSFRIIILEAAFNAHVGLQKAG